MGKIIHYTEQAPEPVGPYSQAIEVGGFIYCSGQIAIDAKTQEVFTGDIQKQTEIIFANIKAVLASCDLNLSHVVKTMIFLTDMADFAKVNEVYGKHFSKEPPARSCVAVTALPKSVTVEIEVIARRF